MGDRFYEAQLRATGSCPGMKTKSRRRKVAWDDEKKAKAIEMYQEADPTPETSVEIVKEIADELEESVNGVRMILTKAGVYVKKTTAVAGKGSTKTEGTGSKVSKQAAFEKLVKALNNFGVEADMSIIEKMTGKAALYFAEVLHGINKE